MQPGAAQYKRLYASVGATLAVARADDVASPGRPQGSPLQKYQSIVYAAAALGE